jgi:hypothetical protein
MGRSKLSGHWVWLLCLVGNLATEARALEPQSPTLHPPPPLTGPVTLEDPRSWTTGPVRRMPTSPTTTRVVTLRAVRTERHEGFDRTVFEFDGMQIPRYEIKYMKEGQTPKFGGSAEEIPMVGQAFLKVRFYPAKVHGNCSRAKELQNPSYSRWLDTIHIQEKPDWNSLG